MCVVKQLITYFHNRGVLTPRQLDYLVREGFFNPYEEEVGEVCDADLDWREACRERARAIEDEACAELEKRVRGRKQGGKGRRGRGRKAPTLLAAELASRIERLSATWQSALGGLAGYARRLKLCDDWREASRVVRNSDADSLQRALAASLGEGRPSLRRLWGSLMWDAYHQVVGPADAGPAVTAYRRILGANRLEEASKYAWLLRQRPVRAMLDLREAQRRVLRAARAIYDEQEETIALALRRQCDPVAFWTFALVYNARRPSDRRCLRSEVRDDDCGPPFPEPDVEQMRKVWLAAVVIDPESVLRFLCVKFGAQGTGPNGILPSEFRRWTRRELPAPSDTNHWREHEKRIWWTTWFCPIRWLPKGAVVLEREIENGSNPGG
jgi:hypothetical protein